MKEIVLIFPHQLFENNILLNKKKGIFLVEDFLFFRQYKFHKQKLILHRASMKFYEKFLLDSGYKVEYVESKNLLNRKSLGEILAKQKITHISCYEVVDSWLEKDLRAAAKKNNLEVNFVNSPMFINSKVENFEFFEVKNKKPFMKTFYEWQRKRLKILVDDENKPVGGKFSFDTENRKKLPKNFIEPINLEFTEGEFVQEAKKYVDKNFADNYGLVENFNYAIDFKDAKKVLENFLENKLENFGIYEDSIAQEFDFINHSILTPYLNIGLLTPKYVVRETLKYAKDNSKTIPLNSLEGFLRQIIGWREFMRAMYELHGSKMRTRNFFENKNSLDENFWSATTGNFVLDNTIQKVLKNCYCHHIERLMVLGNYFLLSGIEPEEVYKWFMELFIDSYDWVMVPNVYSMSQFADGGIFATKPYICASNYILKMSDYKKDGIWDKEFDEKFWGFLKKHRVFLSKNIRFKMLVGRIK